MLMRLRLGLAAALLLIAALTGAAAAEQTGVTASVPSVVLALDKTGIALDEVVTLTVAVSGATDVYGSVVDVVYDPALIQLVEAAPGSLVVSGLTPEQTYLAVSNEAVAGGVRTTALALRLGEIAGASGSGSIGVFKFKGLAAASVAFALETNVFVELVDSATEFIQTAPDTGAVHVVVGAVTPQISGPAQGSFLSTSQVTIAGSAAASTTLVPVIDGTDGAGVNAAADGSFSFTKLLTDGPHTISVRDQFTGVASAEVQVTVDSVAPALSVGEIPRQESVNLTGTVSDANLDKLYIQVNPTGDPVAGDEVPVNTDGSFAKEVTVSSGASHQVRVTAVDKAGNQTVVNRTWNLLSDTVIRIVSASPTVGVTATFTVDVMVEKVANLAGVTLNLVFDPDRLEVVDADDSTTEIEVSNGNVFAGKSSFVATNNLAVNEDGTITYTGLVTNSGHAVTTESASLISVVFRAKGPGETTIGYSASEPTVLGAPGGANIAVGEFAPLTVIAVEGGTVTGRVTRDGQTDHGGIPIRILGAGDAVIASGTTTATGDFTILVPQAGTFAVVFDLDGWSFVRRTNIAVTLGGTTTIPGFALFRGDMNRDSYINVLDLLWMAEALGKRPEQVGWKPASDVNGDTYINVLDLLNVAPNIGKRP